MIGPLIQHYNRYTDRHDCDLNAIRCDPEFRQPFLDEFRRGYGPVAERDVFRTLEYLAEREMIAKKRRSPRPGMV